MEYTLQDCLVSNEVVYESFEEDTQGSTTFYVEEEVGDGEDLNLVVEEEVGDGEDLNLVVLKEADFKWNHTNTLFFLDEFQKRIHKFRNPTIKKKTFWQEIANDMNIRGYKVDAEMLDRKMRNMKATFNKIKDNNRKTKTGRGKINWEYFDRFNEIFADDKTVNITNIEASVIAASDITVRECPEQNSQTASPLVSPSLSNTPSNSREKQKRLDIFRKRQIKLEEERVDELKKIRLEIAESNRISREKLELFKQFLEREH